MNSPDLSIKDIKILSNFAFGDGIVPVFDGELNTKYCIYSKKETSESLFKLMLINNMDPIIGHGDMLFYSRLDDRYSFYLDFFLKKIYDNNGYFGINFVPCICLSDHLGGFVKAFIKLFNENKIYY